MSHSVATETTLIKLLQDQLQRTQDHLEQVMRQTQERDHQAQVEKARLLSLLETEQQARRDLEQKLLPPPPKPAAASNTRRWILLVLLVIVLAGLVVSLIRPELIRRLIIQSFTN